MDGSAVREGTACRQRDESALAAARGREPTRRRAQSRGRAAARQYLPFVVGGYGEEVVVAARQVGGRHERDAAHVALRGQLAHLRQHESNEAAVPHHARDCHPAQASRPPGLSWGSDQLWPAQARPDGAEGGAAARGAALSDRWRFTSWHGVDLPSRGAARSGRGGLTRALHRGQT